MRRTLCGCNLFSSLYEVGSSCTRAADSRPYEKYRTLAVGGALQRFFDKCGALPIDAWHRIGYSMEYLSD